MLVRINELHNSYRDFLVSVCVYLSQKGKSYERWKEKERKRKKMQPSLTEFAEPAPVVRVAAYVDGIFSGMTDR